MSDRATHRLLDASEACAAIEGFIDGHSLDAYQAEYGLRLQIERLLEIVGEALNQARAIDPTIATQITDFQLIIDMRNRLIHGYSGLDDRIVWVAATTHVPILHGELKTILGENE